MNKVKNFIIFFILPMVIIALLIFNAQIASKRYTLQSDIRKNEYNASIKSDITTLTLKPYEEKNIKVNVKNNGTVVWTPAEKNDIDLSYQVLKNDKIILEGERCRLPNPVANGQEVSLDLKIKSPSEPGKYKVELDMVHEDVTWFKEKGSKTYTIEINVEQ